MAWQFTTTHADFRDNASMQWLRRFFRRNTARIPESLWHDCVARLPFLHRLSVVELANLKAVSETLLDRTSFTGAGGFEMSDETAVLIAAQAALPILKLTPDLYRDMAGVLVYPSAFVVPQSEVDEAGIVHEWHEPVSGEALDAGGAIVLSWQDVEQSGQSDVAGDNVVIHEFAHKIDMGDGMANGCPPFLPAYHAAIGRKHWQRAFSAAYEDFVRQVGRLEARLPDEQLPDDFDVDAGAHAARYEELYGRLPLDAYAASHPAEFFAVASEAFFVLPQPLAAAYPEVFRLFALYYRQDPLAATSAAAPAVAIRKTGGKHL